MYSRFEEETSASSVLGCTYHKNETFREIGEGIRDFSEPFVAEVSLPLAADLISRMRQTDKKLVIIGAFTSFARGAEITALYHPRGKLKEAQYLEVADPLSIVTWLALMFLKAVNAPLLGDPKTLVARIRITERYKYTIDYATCALRAGILPLLDLFLVAGWPKQLEELQTVAKGKLEKVDLYDWYWKEISHSKGSFQQGTLLSRVGVARKRDVEEYPKLYRDYLDLWETWKSSVTKRGQSFWMLHPEVRLADIEIDLACEFIDKAREMLGGEIVKRVGVCPTTGIDSNDDFYL